MKTLKYLSVFILAIFLGGCDEDTMDDINRNRNDASSVDAFALLPDAILKTANVASANDMAWYSSQWIEHSAGQWAQSHDDDRRLGQNATSAFNNSWNEMYLLQNVLNQIKELTSPGGAEENNKHALGIAQVLSAYNLAIMTDFWGDMPWSEAIQGAGNMKPKFDRQSVIYTGPNGVFELLESGIANLQAAKEQTGGPNAGGFDFLYQGNNDRWIKAAWSLKARYHLRLSQRDNDAAAKALAALANGFQGAADALMFKLYEPLPSPRNNPWYQYRVQRSHLASSSTLFNLMDERNDPRIERYFTTVGGEYNPAPPGQAERTQGGTYSEGKVTADNQAAPTPLMTYHELKFIEAEARQRAGQSIDNVRTALREAVVANFIYHGATADAANEYFDASVAARFTENPLREILTQKYIGAYEYESMEAYHDYRRTGIPQMHNPNNATVGFPNRLQYGNSEESNNPANFIRLDVHKQKVWWAGGEELAN
jgi:hypothetical protein